MKATIVIGHKNPDTDSVCSAIAYAALKHRLTGEEYIPCRAGELNNETRFVLEHFGVEEPMLIRSLEPSLADVQYREIEGIDMHLSLRRVWDHMRDRNIQTVPIVTKRGKIKGIVTLGDIARFYMDDQGGALARAHTPYLSIADALGGEIVAGDPAGHFAKGKVVVAAANPDLMEDYIDENDLVILGNRYESQLCAIEMKAACIVICLGSKASRSILRLAEKAGCTIIETPLDTYTVSKRINQSIPVSHIMKKDGIISFGIDESVADVKNNVSKHRIRYFPILDGDDRYLGMISQRNLLDIDRQRVIMVDHNERGQAVDGIRSARVVEVIDHHRIDSVETMNPIYFRNQPLGCTSTIIAMMYRENKLEIDPIIAGLMLSAIISDTLMFRSPTCTMTDATVARELAAIAEVNVEEYATAMFNAGSKLKGKSPEELFYTDQKRFSAEHTAIAVSQITSVSRRELDRVRDRMIPYMESSLEGSGADMLFMMLTNIIDESTELLFVGQNARAVVAAAFDVEPGEHTVMLKGVVSRKKQILAPLIAAIEAM